MNTSDPGIALDEFDYHLPEERIAQKPTDRRDQSRLLRWQRESDTLSHHRFSDLRELLGPTDTLVINDSRVIPARLRGRKTGSSGSIEILLLRSLSPSEWWVMLKPGKRVREGTTVQLDDTHERPSPIGFVVREKNEEGHCRIEFTGTNAILDELDGLGEIPLPPYIEPAKTRDYDDKTRYQTVYARSHGSVAAPTAGLHFTEALLSDLQAKGVTVVRVTLHVGLGTFAPVKATQIADHTMHHEFYELSPEAATTLNQQKAQGHRIIAVGTTAVRVLESAANAEGQLVPQTTSTDIFIYPPYQFRFVDALITNFHLPKSTLLMLISAFAEPGSLGGIKRMRRCYDTAIAEKYRFYSYGDAMFLE